MNKKELSKEVRLLMDFKKRSGWRYPQIADAIGVSVPAVKKWFAGDYKPSRLARKAIWAFLVDKDEI